MVLRRDRRLARMLGAQAASLRGGAPPLPVMLTYRYVGFNGQTPNKTWAANATKNMQLFRIPDWVMSDSNKLAVFWDNWAFTGSEVNGTSTYQLIRVSVEIPGAPTPVVALTFSASRTKTFTAGQALVVSDELDASAFGLSYFPAGTQIWIKGIAQTTGSVTDVTRDRGVMNGPGGAATITGALAGYYQSPGDSTDTNQVDAGGAWNVGAITTGGGAVGTNVHFHSGVIGRTTAAAAPIVSLVDSLGDGYFCKGFDGVNGPTGGLYRGAAWAAQKPIFTHGLFGTSSLTYSTKTTALVEATYGGSRLFAAGLYEGFTNLFDGVNTLATIQTHVLAICSVLANAGGGGARAVYMSEMVIPNEFSTAGATSYVSQSKYAGGAAYFEAFNTWLATKGPAGDNTIQGILPWYGMYSAANSNKITVPGVTWTLGAAVAAAAGTVRLTGATAPVPGQGIWLSGGTAEAVMVDTVTVVTPGSVWDVTLIGVSNTQSALITGVTGFSHASGSAAAASYQPFDRSHFTQEAHGLMAASLVGNSPF